MSAPASPEYRRPFAILLAVAAAAVVFFMAHHPTSHGAGGLAGMVHGVMLALLLALGVAFAHFAHVRGLQRLTVMTGLVAYLASMLAHFAAATLNGFVAPAMAAREPLPQHDLFVLIWEANQALAFLGVMATGIAYVAWSLDLLRDRAALERGVALFGLLAGILPAAALLSGRFSMDVHTALAVYSAHAAWAVAVAIVIWRRAASADTD